MSSNNRNYYVVFGQVHRHPETDVALKDYWVLIKAPTIESAENAAWSRFGQQFSRVLEETPFLEDHQEYFPKGQYEIIEVDE